MIEVNGSFIVFVSIWGLMFGLMDLFHSWNIYVCIYMYVCVSKVKPWPDTSMHRQEMVVIVSVYLTHNNLLFYKPLS